MVAMRWGLLAFLALSVLCAEPVAAADRDYLVVARPSDIKTLDPTVETSDIASSLYKSLYDQLTETGTDGSIGPKLATSFSASEDAKTWTFKIRGDAKLPDGSSLTADDVVWTYRTILGDATSPMKAFVAQVESVEKTAPDTVVFHLNTAFGAFDRQVSLISVVQQKSFETMGRPAFAQKGVGSGPYQVVNWVRDSQIELAANPHWWGKPVAIKKIIIRPVDSESARLNGLRSGELDLAQTLPPAGVAAAEAEGTIKVAKVPSNRVIYLGFNYEDPIAGNVKFRQAVDAAIDRNALTSRLLRGLGKPEGEMLAPVTFGYDASIKPTAFDAAKSKKLLEEAGYKGEKIPFHYATNRWPFAAEVAQAIGNYLKAVGVNVELTGVDYTTLFTLWQTNKLPGIYMFGYGPTNLDASLPLNSLYVLRAAKTDPFYLPLVEAQRSTADPAKRKAAISQVLKHSQEVAAYAPLYNEFETYGYGKNVSFKARPDGVIPLAEVSFVGK